MNVKNICKITSNHESVNLYWIDSLYLFTSGRAMCLSTKPFLSSVFLFSPGGEFNFLFSQQELDNVKLLRRSYPVVSTFVAQRRAVSHLSVGDLL